MHCHHIIFKIIELGLVLTCMFLARFGYRGYIVFFGFTPDHAIFGYIVLVIYLIYLPSFLLAQLLGEYKKPPWRTDLILSFTGCILYLALGTEVIQAHEVAVAREKDIPDFDKLLKKLATNIIVKNIDPNFYVEDNAENWFAFVTSKFRFIHAGKALGAMCIITGIVFFLDFIVLMGRLTRMWCFNMEDPDALNIHIKHPPGTPDLFDNRRQMEPYQGNPSPVVNTRELAGSRMPDRNARDTRSRSPEAYANAGNFDRKLNRSVEFASHDRHRRLRSPIDDERRPESRSSHRKSRSGSDNRGRKRGNERANDSSPDERPYIREAMARGSYVAYANYGSESGDESSGDERRQRQRQQRGRSDSPELDRKSRTSQTSPKIGMRGKARTKEPVYAQPVKTKWEEYGENSGFTYFG